MLVKEQGDDLNILEEVKTLKQSVTRNGDMESKVFKII